MTHDLLSTLNLIKQNNILFLDLKTIDLVGRLHHVTLPLRDGTLETVMEQGVGFDGSSYGFTNIENSDMIQRPDLSTCRIDRFRGHPTLTCFTNIVLADGRDTPFPQDVRYVARRAEELIRSLGIADTSLWGPEFEFYIFSRVEFDTRTSASYYKVEHAEEFFQNAYHACNPFDLYDDFRDESCILLEKAGVPVKYHHHEVGERGQQEIEVFFEPLLKTADSIMTVKYLLLSLAEEKNLHITFMPKPMYNQSGSGLHLHQFLLNQARNIFHDAAGYAGFSRTGLHYIGGLLKHAPALAAFTNPSTNSYKRLVPGFEAPVAVTFGQANRSSAVRIPRYVFDPAETRLEYRPPDATANPYLMLAALLMAGIDGIISKIDPMAEGYGPAESNSADASGTRFLPRSLTEALDALENDNAFLLRGGVFPDSLITQWLKTKREEVHAIATMPHPFEYKMYFHR